MAGEIDRQRLAIETHLDEVLERKGKREAKRQRDIMDYLEGCFSEAQIRQFYALYLWGRSWRADYQDCPPPFQAYAETALYEEALTTLINNWKKFKQADNDARPGTAERA